MASWIVKIGDIVNDTETPNHLRWRQLAVRLEESEWLKSIDPSDPVHELVSELKEVKSWSRFDEVWMAIQSAADYHRAHISVLTV